MGRKSKPNQYKSPKGRHHLKIIGSFFSSVSKKNFFSFSPISHFISFAYFWGFLLKKFNVEVIIFYIFFLFYSLLFLYFLFFFSVLFNFIFLFFSPSFIIFCYFTVKYRKFVKFSIKSSIKKMRSENKCWKQFESDSKWPKRITRFVQFYA